MASTTGRRGTVVGGEVVMEVDEDGSGEVGLLVGASPSVMIGEIESDVTHHKVVIATSDTDGEFVDTDESHIETVVAPLGLLGRSVAESERGASSLSSRPGSRSSRNVGC